MSLYPFPSQLQVITCVLVGNNAGIGLLLTRVAPSAENEINETNSDPQGCSRANLCYCRNCNGVKSCNMEPTHIGYNDIND